METSEQSSSATSLWWKKCARTLTATSNDSLLPSWRRVFSKAVSGHGAHVDTFGDYELLRFSLDLSWSKNSDIRVSDIERDHDISIVAFIRKDGSLSSIPASDSMLHHGDLVMACVRTDLVDSFRKYMQA